MTRRVRFGPFEIDRAAMELRKHGLRVRLQKQPFQILTALLDRPHEVVTRAELHRTVWSGDTFVDCEHGLNAAINKLRQALGDSAESPKYIETIPGVGYRWLAPVEAIDAGAGAPITPSIEATAGLEAPARPVAPSKSLAASSRFGVLLAILLVGAAAGWILRSATVRLPPAALMTFTIGPPEGAFFEPALTRQDFAISPDGEHLAFVASTASHSQLWVREIRSLHNVALAPDRHVRGVVWSPDSRFVYFDERNTVWRVSIDGGVAQTICQLAAGPPWMGLLHRADGLVLYTRAGSYQVPASGGTPRLIDAAPYQWVEPLPDGRILQVQFDPEIQRYRAIVEDPAPHQGEARGRRSRFARAIRATGAGRGVISCTCGEEA